MRAPGVKRTPVSIRRHETPDWRRIAAPRSFEPIDTVRALRPKERVRGKAPPDPLLTPSSAWADQASHTGHEYPQVLPHVSYSVS